MAEVEFFSLLGIGVAAFVATNIDDIFVLMIFFANRHFQTRKVVLGQYLGIVILTAVSAVGSFLAFVVPPFIIGLMGFVPITIGIINLVRLNRGEEVPQKVTKTKNGSYLSFLTVAAVTVSNGGDNIGVYTALFAKYNSVNDVFMVVTTFMAMTAVWSIIGYYLVNHQLIANRILSIGHILLPFVLIGLGLYILLDSFFVQTQ